MYIYGCTYLEVILSKTRGLFRSSDVIKTETNYICRDILAGVRVENRGLVQKLFLSMPNHLIQHKKVK